MRYLLITLLFPLYCNAQYPIYTEINGGTGITNIYNKEHQPMISLNVGRLLPLGSHGFADFQVGLAMPSIFTSKLLVGTWFNESKCVSLAGGFRLYPGAICTQLMFGEPDGIQVQFSGEIGGTATRHSPSYEGMFNMGIRIPFKIKDEDE